MQGWIKMRISASESFICIVELPRDHYLVWWVMVDQTITPTIHLEVSCTNSYTKLKLYNICFTCNIVFHNIVHSDGVLYYLLTDYDVF